VRGSLEGANCADLPGFVIDKYFDSDINREPLRAMVARAICARCVVREECRDQALTMPGLQHRGIIGGVTAHEIRRARGWSANEAGVTDRVPPGFRPDWLKRTDATETVEQGRVESDADEPPMER
jgi:hypothetical protein